MVENCNDESAGKFLQKALKANFTNLTYKVSKRKYIATIFIL